MPEISWEAKGVWGAGGRGGTVQPEKDSGPSGAEAKSNRREVARREGVLWTGLVPKTY